MTRNLSWFVLSILYCTSIYSQNLTLTDLKTLCSKKNWEEINQTLMAKKWEYFDSKKGSTIKYSTITWSYKKQDYNDKAEAWFYLYTFEGYPNKLSYYVFNKESYTLIQKSIATSGFKLTNSEIEDNEIISTYDNINFTLKISTQKRNDDEDWREGSLTAYSITIIKKSGIYDPDNGMKSDYYSNGTLKAEYMLTNGKLNGKIKTFHENGEIEKIGIYSNGVENGLFKLYNENGKITTEYSVSNGKLNGTLKRYASNGILIKIENYFKGLEQGVFIEYDEYGIKEAEYKMENGMKNGLLKIYEEGKISYSTTLKDDIKNGQHIEYYYNDKTGELQMKYIGNYLNNEKNGTWSFFLIEDNKEKLLTYDNYINGSKNGKFKNIKSDSLIIGSYRNGELHGEYKIYIDIISPIFGGIIKTDTTLLTLITIGDYIEGNETGVWKFYDKANFLIREGAFLNGKETGLWKYFYPKWSNDLINSKSIVNQLYLTRNYRDGLLDGKSIRYSYIDKVRTPCIENNKNTFDTCYNSVIVKVLQTTNYKNDELNGECEFRDSLNEIIAKGSFKNNLKEGIWIHSFTYIDLNNKVCYNYQKGNYKNDKREGEFIQYGKEGKIIKTLNFKNNELNGEYVLWNQYNKPIEKKQFINGKLTELITFDSLGENSENKYEIYEETFNGFKCRKTDYFEDGYKSQEYTVKKDKEIDHDLFEYTFLLFLNEGISNGISFYEEGDFNLFNSTNQPIVTGEIIENEKNGLWTFYYYNQNLKVESNFLKGNKIDEKYFKLTGENYSGEFIYYDNEIKEIRKIKNGLRNGKTTYIDIKTDKKIKKENYKNGELKI